MKSLVKSVRLALTISGLFSVAVILAYVVAKGWEESAFWGAFGDFVGGILNPVFAFANVVILVVISYQLAEIEEARSEKDRVSQERLARFGMRYAAIQEVNAFQLALQKAVSEFDSEQIFIMRSKLWSSVISYQILFMSLEDFDLGAILTRFHTLYRAARNVEKVDSMDPAEVNYDGYVFQEELDRAKDEYRTHIPPVYDIVNLLQTTMTRDVISGGLAVLNTSSPDKRKV